MSTEQKKAPPAHPPYKEMIFAAITSLKDRKGASRQAIMKYITANYNVSENAAKLVNNAIKKAVEVGSLELSKDSRARFKLSEATKASAKKTVKKPVAKKVAAVKKTKPKKPAAKTTKKPAKPAVKKSVKSPKKAKSPAKTKSPKKPVAKVATKKAAGKKSTPKKTVKKPAVKKTTKTKK